MWWNRTSIIRKKHLILWTLTTTSFLVGSVYSWNITPPPIIVMNRPAFLKSIGGFFSGVVYNLEGSIASDKVNANRDTSVSKYAVISDEEYNQQKGESPPTLDHSDWDILMKTYVSPGKIDDVTTNVVDYKALAKDAKFDAYVKSLETVDLASLQQPNELLALYINAYNALCIGHVLRYYRQTGELPVSVKNAGTASTEVWNLPAGIVGGESLSLDDIENKILRSKWDEPRIHASIVCASASCPNLRPEAFVASKINAQMEDQVTQWMADPTKGLAVAGGDATFSRIFLWYKNDFTGGPVTWAEPYMSTKQSQTINSEAPLNYFAYNWNLNNNKSS